MRRCPQAKRPLIVAGARQDVVKFAIEQTEDGFEFLTANRHLRGKIAFDDQRRVRITRPPSPRELSISPNAGHCGPRSNLALARGQA
jgi:hypothetical protein